MGIFLHARGPARGARGRTPRACAGGAAGPRAEPTRARSGGAQDSTRTVRNEGL